MNVNLSLLAHQPQAENASILQALLDCRSIATSAHSAVFLAPQENAYFHVCRQHGIRWGALLQVRYLLLVPIQSTPYPLHHTWICTVGFCNQGHADAHTACDLSICKLCQHIVKALGVV